MRYEARTHINPVDSLLNNRRTSGMATIYKTPITYLHGRVMSGQFIINYIDYAKGSIFLLLNANVVHPREVFKLALTESAAHIIVAHNHPSGDPTPSWEDIEITKKLVETGNIMGITVLDHVIIGDGRHFSMKESGHI